LKNIKIGSRLPKLS